MYGQMVLWKKKKKIEVCLSPDFYLMHSHIYMIYHSIYTGVKHILQIFGVYCPSVCK